ncbi:MFS transporter [uncultured Cellulomonas sp.]|uniref:MFS transporter n=1 Tax=uncultured Cellulomonas sp. TaxID=189682 RepID=UPI002603D897|nr:MFS transporter [uncultured Cellulomonas sp.]
MARTAAPALPLRGPFGHLVAATGASNLADGLLVVGVPLLAVTLTRSPADVALLSAAVTLPWLLLALHAGVLVDRHDRARILAVASAGRATLLAVAAAAAASGTLSVPALLTLLLLVGTAEVFSDSAAGALVPAVVPREHLGAANGRLLGIQQLANAFLGGPLAGPLVALGGGWLFGAPATLFAVATALTLRGLRGVGPATGDRTTPSPRTSMRSEVAEGVRFLWSHPVLRPLVIGSTVLNFASTAYFAVFVLWVVGPGSAVGLDPALYGTLTMGLAAGALAGAACADRLRRRVGEARLIGSTWLSNGVLLAVPVLVPHVAAITVTFALVGFTTMVGNVTSQSMRQRLVPGRLLGRVGGAARTLAYGSIPLGAAAGGALGEAAGLVAVFVTAVVLSTALAAWVLHAVPQRAIDDADAALRQAAAPTPVSATAPSSTVPAVPAGAAP